MKKRDDGYALGQTWRGHMPAIEVVLNILEGLPKIEEWDFKTYTPVPTLVEEFKTKPPLIEEAETESEKRLIMERLLKQSASDEEVFTVKRDEITLARLRALTEKIAASGRGLSVCSRVRLKNRRIYHLPMMDFTCPADDFKMLFVVQRFAKSLGLHGAILESGRSYHFYGFRLMTQKELAVFLGYGILFGNYTDVRYIGHRLIQGYACLRISTSSRHRVEPRLISIV